MYCQSSKPQILLSCCEVVSAGDCAIGRVTGATAVIYDSSVSGKTELEIVSRDTSGSYAGVPAGIDVSAYAKETRPASSVFVDLTKEPYSAKRGTDITSVLQTAIESLGKQVKWFAILREDQLVKAEISLCTNKKESPLALLERLSAMPGIRVENME